MKAPIADINADLAPRMVSLALALLGEPTERAGCTWRWGRKGSLAVVVDGAKRGAWHDHEAGVGGDPLGLIAHALRMPMRDALGWAQGWLGDPAGDQAPRAPKPPQRPPEPRRESSGTMDLARTIWREAVPPAGTIVEAYLASRGLELPADAPLRFHPACPRGAERVPAMIALMTRPETAEPCGVHRTYLRPDGSGKAEGQAKMMAGHAGVIRLVPDEDVIEGLGIAEGIETALAVMQGFAWSPVWAATSAGAIASFPVLPSIGDLTIFADADAAGTTAADACAARWRDAGRHAAVLRPPAGDFNDLLREAA